MNQLSMSLRAEPRMVQLMACSVCHQPIDPMDQTTLRAKLFGARQYAVCISCGQEAPDPDDRAYRQRWGKRWRMLHANPNVQRNNSP